LKTLDGHFIRRRDSKKSFVGKNESRINKLKSLRVNFNLGRKYKRSHVLCFLDNKMFKSSEGQNDCQELSTL